MRQVVIAIDAGEQKCGKCQWYEENHCKLLDPYGLVWPIYRGLVGTRHPACIEAERKYATMNNLAPKGCHDVEEYYKDEPTEAEKAEAKLKRLIEAARVLLDSYAYLINGGDARFLDPTKADEVLAVLAALKEIEPE